MSWCVRACVRVSPSMRAPVHVCFLSCVCVLSFSCARYGRLCVSTRTRLVLAALIRPPIQAYSWRQLSMDYTEQLYTNAPSVKNQFCREQSSNILNMCVIPSSRTASIRLHRPLEFILLCCVLHREGGFFWLGWLSQFMLSPRKPLHRQT